MSVKDKAWTSDESRRFLLRPRDKERVTPQLFSDQGFVLIQNSSTQGWTTHFAVFFPITNPSSCFGKFILIPQAVSWTKIGSSLEPLTPRGLESPGNGSGHNKIQDGNSSFRGPRYSGWEEVAEGGLCQKVKSHPRVPLHKPWVGSSSSRL